MTLTQEHLPGYYCNELYLVIHILHIMLFLLFFGKQALNRDCLFLIASGFCRCKILQLHVYPNLTLIL